MIRTRDLFVSLAVSSLFSGACLVAIHRGLAGGGEPSVDAECLYLATDEIPSGARGEERASDTLIHLCRMKLKEGYRALLGLTQDAGPRGPGR